MGEQSKPNTRMGFIREKNEREIKIKESELGRDVVESDIPHCFGVHLDGDVECNKCAISFSCVEWGKVYSKKEEKPEPEELKEEEKVEAKDTVEVKPAKAKSKTKGTPEEAPGDATEPLTGSDGDALLKQLESWGVHEGDWTVKKNKKVFPKGYVNGKIMLMLEAGTTRKNLKDFVGWIGYGEPQLNYTLRCLRKKKRLIEDDQGNVRTKE